MQSVAPLDPIDETRGEAPGGTPTEGRGGEGVEPILVWSMLGPARRSEPQAARLALTAAVGAYTGLPAAHTVHEPGRAPRVVGASGVVASVSRAEGVAMGVVSTSLAVGIDVEVPSRASWVQEIAGLIGAIPGTPANEVLALWTRKEALAKAMGTGLPDDVRTLAVPHVAIEPGRWFRVDGWLWIGCPCEAGRVASLVVRDPGPDEAGTAPIIEREPCEPGVRSWSIAVSR